LSLSPNSRVEENIRECVRWWLTTIVVVPAARITAAAATTAVFAFVHAIIFNAPFTKARVDPPAAAPLAAATAEIVLASATGAV
jgi:hypothetical protein